MSVIQFLEDPRKIFTVSEITSDLKNLMEDNFADVWISGEISNFKRASSGHLYFTLKDSKACLSVVMFRGQNYQLKFEIEDGMEVIVHGRFSVYELRGQYQVILDYLEPKGLGALQLAFEQLKKKCEAEGLFDLSHKKQIPFLPLKVGIITSSKGAALHDMITVLKRRYAHVDILIHPTQVQGEKAKFEIASAIVTMDGLVDVIIVGRGGGSIEDLWAFNEEEVVRAIYHCQTPIISAVGHQTDITLSDFVADLRAPTPSAAAELAVPLIEDVKYSLNQNSQLLHLALKKNCENWRQQIVQLKKQLKSPKKYLEDIQLKLDDKYNQLIKTLENILQTKKFELRELQLKFPSMQKWIAEKKLVFNSLQKRLQTNSPMNPLKKGYSLVRLSNQKKLLKSSTSLKKGEILDIQFYDGRITAIVK